jgi:hypothetical protein
MCSKKDREYPKGGGNGDLLDESGRILAKRKGILAVECKAA